MLTLSIMEFGTSDEKDNSELSFAIEYFKSIISNNITDKSQHNICATFIGIRTNISGKSKLHIYIMLFPFIENITQVSYPKKHLNFHIRDICLSVDSSFYLWLYTEMRKQNSIVILSFEDCSLKVVNGTCDLLISIDKNCHEKKEWMDLEFEDWYKKHFFNNIFTITILNPYLYMVPFPVKNIIIKTHQRYNNYCDYSLCL